MIEYPRTCDSCARIYKSQSSFSTHKKRCHIYATKKKKKKVAVTKGDTEPAAEIVLTQTNNILHQQYNNNNVVINVHSSAEAASVLHLLAPTFNKASHTPQQIKAMRSALTILSNDGVKTQQALQEFIQSKAISIQQLEQDVADCDDFLCHHAVRQGGIDARRLEGKQLDQESIEFIDLHLKQSALHLFRSMVTDRSDDESTEVEYHITKKKLASNPLYLSNDGLSAWSQESGIKQSDADRKNFGKLDRSERCRWLSVNDKLLWTALIMNVLLERLKKWMKNQNRTEQYEKLIDRYHEITARCEEEEAFVSPIMKEMKKCLADNCKELHVQGWHYVAGYVSSNVACDNAITN